MTQRTQEATFFLDQPVHRIDTGRARVACRRLGAGEPLLLIHGWPFTGFVYRKLLPRLAERFACYVVDLPGAGESEWDDGNDFSFHGHAENLRRLREALGLGPYRILAHDTGATVARRLAILEGDRVSQGEVLLLWGEGDPFFPIQRAREMVPQFARCRGLIPIPGCKLLPHEERPQAVLEHTLAFFAGGAA